MDATRGADAGPGSWNRKPAGPPSDRAYPDYGSYDGIWMHKESVLGAFVAFLSRLSISGIAVVATFVSLSYIGAELASSPDLTALGLVGALVVAGMVFAFGTIVFVVGRKQDAETSAERGDRAAQPGGQQGGSSEAEGSSESDGRG